MNWIDWYASCPSTDILSYQTSLYRSKLLKSRLEKYLILHLHVSSQTEICSLRHVTMKVLSLDNVEERYLLSGGSSGMIALHDLQSYARHHIDDEQAQQHDDVNKIQPMKAKQIRSMTMNNNIIPSISSIQWSPIDAGMFIVSTIEGTLQIFDPTVFTKVSSLYLPSMSIYTAAMSPHYDTSSTIAIGTSACEVVLYDIISGDASHKLIGHTDSVSTIAWSPYHPYQIASGSVDGSIKLWDVRKAGHHGLQLSFDWRNDHKMNLSSDTSSHIHHDEASLRKIKRFDWSKDQQARAHDSAVKYLRYTSCGRYIISSGNDKKIRLWQASNGELLHINYNSGFKSDLSYAFDIASFDRVASDLLIYPTPTGSITLTPINSFNGHSIRQLHGHIGMVHAVVYRKQYQQIISCGRDKMIHLWDCSSAPTLAKPHYHRDSHNDHDEKVYHDVDDGDDDGNHDNWSDDDVDDMVDASRRSKTRRRKASSAVDDASHHRGRFFMPPIIQHYINDMDASPSPQVASVVHDISIQPSSSSSSSQSHTHAQSSMTEHVDDVLDDHNHIQQKQARGRSSKNMSAIDQLRKKYAAPTRIRR